MARPILQAGFKVSTVLSRASAHRHSQLKHQKLRVGGYTKEVLEWSNYLRANAHPWCEVSCQGRIDLNCRFARASSTPAWRWKTLYRQCRIHQVLSGQVCCACVSTLQLGGSGSMLSRKFRGYEIASVALRPFLGQYNASQRPDDRVSQLPFLS